MKNFAFIIATVFLFSACKENKKETMAQAGPTASQSTIYYGGDILTMEGDAPTYAEAIVQNNGKIVFVGSKEEALSRHGENAQQIDLKGKTCSPPFSMPTGISST